MKRVLIAVGLIFCLVAASCDNGTYLTPYTPTKTTTATAIKATNILSNYFAYTDPAKYFSISYPPDWEAFPDSMSFIPWSKDLFKYYSAEAELKGSFFVFGASSTDYTGDVNLVIQSLSEMKIRGWDTLEDVVQGRILETRTRVDDFYEYSRDYILLGNNEGIAVMWGSTVSGVSARCIQVFTIADELVWKLTCNISLSKYDQGKADINAIIRSLRILK
jgi:hypothetical protein